MFFGEFVAEWTEWQTFEEKTESREQRIEEQKAKGKGQRGRLFFFLCGVAERKIKNEYPADYLVVGIASSLKEYKFCFHLSRLLGIELRKADDLVFEPADRSRKTQYSVFLAGEETDVNRFVVFANKNLQEVLLPEVPNFDYLLQVFGSYGTEDLSSLLAGIKNFPEVVMTAAIPLKKIKNKERLIYQEEKPRHRPATARLKH